MARSKDQQLMLKWKRKKWFDVKSDDLFNNKEIGKSLAESPEELVGRFINMNLMYITNDPKKQGINVLFKITKTEGSSGVAEVYGYNLIHAMIKRLVRKQTKRIDDSLILKTKDDKYVIIKPMIVTSGRVSRSVRTDVRKFVRKFLVEYFEKNSFKNFVKDVISDTLTNDIKKNLQKITPILHVYIRVFKYVESPNNKQKKLAQEYHNTAKNYKFEFEKEQKTQKPQNKSKTKTIGKQQKKQ